MAIASQPGSGASLTCSSNPQGANAGVATFTGCQITGKAGTYTLSATGAGFSTTTHRSASPWARPRSWPWRPSPAAGPTAPSGAPSPRSASRTAGGNVVTSATNPVTLGIASQPGTGATLSCSTNPQTPAGGVASFAGCQITGKAGTYNFAEPAPAPPGLSGATRQLVQHQRGRMAAQLAFSSQPGGGANGATWGTQPAVSVEDSGGNVVGTNNTASITLATATQPAGGGTSRCDQPQDPQAAGGGHLRRLQDHRQGGQLHL